MRLRVVHLTSAHKRYDPRIFIKMCTSLASFGHKVYLVIADDEGLEVVNNVSIIDVGTKAQGRLSRMTNSVRRILKKAKELDADIYHLHDPELIPVGLILKYRGKRVIFDAHEDLPKQILGKDYLSKVSQVILSKFFILFERITLPYFDAIVCATPFIREKMLMINTNSLDINNYPIIDELSNTSDWRNKNNEIAYIGSISRIRGVSEMISALEHTSGVRLNLAGNFSERSFESEVKGHQSWEKVNELGFLDRKELKIILAASKAGLVTLHPVVNYLDSLPVKMFEYMAASLPVIASNFDLWSEIIEGNKCGICVDPLDPKNIANAIQYIIDHPNEAVLMGQMGRKAVEEKYNWGLEEVKLTKLYENISLPS